MLHFVEIMFPPLEHEDSALLNKFVYSTLGPPFLLVSSIVIQDNAISERIFEAFLVLHEIGETFNHFGLRPILANHTYNIDALGQLLHYTALK